MRNFVSNISNFFVKKNQETNPRIDPKLGLIETQSSSLTAVYRRRVMLESERRTYMTEVLDSYAGWSLYYLKLSISRSFTSPNIQAEMKKIAKALPLLSYFTNSVSRVYATQPVRKFFLDGKEIMKEPKEEKEEAETGAESEPKDEMPKPFDRTESEDKFIFDNELYEALSELYNDDICLALKQAERYTNLVNTAIFKVITDENGKCKMIFVPNDTVEALPKVDDYTAARQLTIIRSYAAVQSGLPSTVQGALIPVREFWTKDSKKIEEINPSSSNVEVNEAALEAEKLYGTKEIGAAFAPFVVFRDSGCPNDFWDLKNNDIIELIESINLELTELRYLTRYTSFNLKYLINLEVPKDAVVDACGMINLKVQNAGMSSKSPPGSVDSSNWEVGEFKNDGKIKEVIDSLIFNLKILFSMYSVPLDSIISSNSVRSAENKQMDNDQLYESINAQREIWQKNEQNLFKVLCSVNNRDNDFQIPKGIELQIDYDEKSSTIKTADDWMVEIQNNVSTVLDWIAELNPDLDRDEIMSLFSANKEINEKNKEEPLNLNAFASVDEKGNMILPKMPEEPMKKGGEEDADSLNSAE